MVKTVELQLAGRRDHKYGIWMASSFQGILMQMLDSEYADELHRNQRHPYSQSLQVKGSELTWRIHGLNKEACHGICDVVFEKTGNQIYLEHGDEYLDVISKSNTSVTYRKLLEDYYFSSCSRYLKIKFLTPASFKQNGEYVLFPTIRLIFQSLMHKYDGASDENTIFSDDLLNHFESYAKIIDYRLRSTRFHLEGTRIPSFMGDITIKISGPQQMVNTAWMLAKFGTYSGVGIKSGMGMGAMTIIEEQGNKE